MSSAKDHGYVARRLAWFKQYAGRTVTTQEIARDYKRITGEPLAEGVIRGYLVRLNGSKNRAGQWVIPLPPEPTPEPVVEAPDSNAVHEELEARLLVSEQQRKAAEEAWVHAEGHLTYVTSERDVLAAQIEQERVISEQLRSILGRNKNRSEVFATNERVQAVLQAALGSPTPREALQMVAMAYPDRIVVLRSALDSAAKEAEGFLHTDKLLGLLRILATAYFDAITGGKGDAAAYATLGYAFAAKDNGHSVRKRTFEYDDRKLVMWRHLRIGVKESAAETIRVYFDWDAKTRKVVIGWCGGHFEH